MSKLLIGIGCICSLLIGGCTYSQIQVDNKASGAISFHFMGKRYDVPASGSTVIKEIPSNTYTYSSQITLDPIYKTWNDEGGLSGTISFKDVATNYLITYGSHVTKEVSGVDTSFTYCIHAITTTNSSNYSNPLSP